MTSTLTIKPNIEHFQSLNLVVKPKPELQHVSYILYPIQIKQQLVEVLIDLNSEVNAINPDFAKKFGLRVYESKINI